MAELFDLSVLAARAGQLEAEADSLLADIADRGVPGSERICSDVEAALYNLVTLLDHAAQVDPRDELPVDGGVHVV